ncbi:unnamed protein product [Symbiodinium microadriaticum]|nr:unnamed protein product [Symbiodinium microadriaticum]
MFHTVRLLDLEPGISSEFKEFDFQTRKRPLKLVKLFPGEGFPSELHAVLGREDSSVYYSQSKISASPTARWQLCGARDLQQAYTRLQLLVTPSESHPLDGLTVKLLPTASSTIQAGVDVLDGEILMGRRVARRLGLWTGGEQFYQPKQLFQQFPGGLYPAGSTDTKSHSRQGQQPEEILQVKGMLVLSTQLADLELLVPEVTLSTFAFLSKDETDEEREARAQQYGYRPVSPKTPSRTTGKLPLLVARMQLAIRSESV